ncbi:hypothetical protein JXA56_04060 [Candidatus Micrarchaeota archaeon]|nr:hypothetical protein [Candidatus Micrarchaeota archaeon]
MKELLTRQRLLSFRKSDPAKLIGKKMTMPDVSTYFQILHARSGWESNEKDTQTAHNFSIDRRMVGRYGERVLMRTIKKAYMPLSYAGKVAKAVSDAGIEVLASDLGDSWVMKARKMGIRAEKRSFEDLPDEHFDAVVCFEPYPVSTNLSGYLGIMRILKNGMPFISITKDHEEIFESVPSFLEIKKSGNFAIRKRKLQESGGDYPLNIHTMTRLAYDYGATVYGHNVFDGKKPFLVDCVIPAKNAEKLVMLDLEVFSKNEKWFREGKVSLSELAMELDVDLLEISASLERIMDILHRRLEIPRLAEIHGLEEAGRMILKVVRGRGPEIREISITG